MKTSVRFLSMLLAILMIASAAVTVSAANVTTVDPLELTEKESVELLVAIGAMQGDEHGNLNLDEKVTRAEAAKIVTVLTTTFTEVGTGATVFSDVPASHWASGFVAYLTNKGVIGGYGDGTFGVNDNVTYDQTLKMLAGALGHDVAFAADWDINTRMLARTLNIGQALFGNIKGNQALTRGQFAIAAVDAMFAEMNQTKSSTNAMGIPVELPMNLYEDVWMFETKSAVVVATADYSLSESYSLIEDEGKDVTLLFDGGNAINYSFEELKISGIKDANELIYGNVKVFLDAEGEIIRTSITVTGEEAEISVDADKETAYINGIEIIEAEEGEVLDEEDRVIAMSFGESSFAPIGLASYALLSEYANNSLAKYMAYNLDGDGDYEMIAITSYSPVEVQSVTDKKVTVNLYGESNNVKVIDADKFVGTVEEKDVAVIYSMYGKTIAEVIEPLVATAEKYTSKKLTLAGSEYEINSVVFPGVKVCTIDNTVIKPDSDGNLVENKYYIWDGKIFGSSVIVDDIGLNFAVLTYINQPSEAKLNSETMQKEVEYTALVTINGKEELVNVDPANTINGLAISDEEDKATILGSFGKVFTNDGVEAVEGGKYVLNRHILVTYAVDDNGKYSFSTTHASNEDYTVVPAGATITIDKNTGLYIIGSGEETVTNRAVIDPAAIIYYTFKKDDTGAHLYLGSYAQETLPEGIVEMTTTAPLYIYEDEETGLINIKLTMIDNESIKLDKGDFANFKTDGRLIKYACYAPNQILSSDGESVHYEYYFADPMTGSNIDATVNQKLSIKDGAVNTPPTTFWTWDEENKNYLRINKTNIAAHDIKCVDMFVLDSAINGCIITEAGSKYSNGVLVPADALIWSYSKNDTTTQYKARTLDAVADMLDVAAENGVAIEAIVFTHLNDKGEEVIFSIFIDWVEVNSKGELLTYKQDAFINFNS